MRNLSDNNFLFLFSFLSLQGKIYCWKTRKGIVEEKKKRNKMFVQLVGKNLVKQQTWSGINKSTKHKVMDIMNARNLLNTKITSKSKLAILLLLRGIQFKRRSQNQYFSEETHFHLEKAYNTCMLNDFQESSFSLSELSMVFAKKWLFAKNIYLLVLTKIVLQGNFGAIPSPVKLVSSTQ